jgi:hypothetical protein
MIELQISFVQSPSWWESSSEMTVPNHIIFTYSEELIINIKPNQIFIFFPQICLSESEWMTQTSNSVKLLSVISRFLMEWFDFKNRSKYFTNFRMKRRFFCWWAMEGFVWIGLNVQFRTENMWFWKNFQFHNQNLERENVSDLLSLWRNSDFPFPSDQNSRNSIGHSAICRYTTNHPDISHSNNHLVNSPNLFL